MVQDFVHPQYHYVILLPDLRMFAPFIGGRGRVPLNNQKKGALSMEIHRFGGTTQRRSRWLQLGFHVRNRKSRRPFFPWLRQPRRKTILLCWLILRQFHSSMKELGLGLPINHCRMFREFLAWRGGCVFRRSK